MIREDCPFAGQCALQVADGVSWKFCPKCGSRAQVLELPQHIDAAVADPDGIYRLPLKNASADMRITADDPQRLIECLGVESTPFGLFYRTRLNRLADGESSHILVSSDDAVRADLWEPHPLRVRSVRITHRHPKIDLAPVPGVVIFLGDTSESEFHLENKGFTTARLGPPHVPSGFEFRDPRDMAGFELAPNQRRAIKICRKPNGVPSDLQFRDLLGQDVVKVRLLPVPTPAASLPPGFVVSIDFGTSNTSVYCLETRSGNVQPISLMGDGKERRETVLYAPLNVDARYWQVFQQGVLAKDILRDLKTLVRERTPGSTARLEFYLRSILRNGIAAYIEGRNPGDERAVEFVFTVPVLDGQDGPDYAHYRDTLLSCAKMAGFEDLERGWRIRTMLEPDGGALEVVSNPDLSRLMTDGERMLIMDVGGGTTDITLGKVRLTDRPHLEEIENISVLSNEDQFGGEMATYILGWRWAKADGEGNLPSGPDRQALGAVNERLKTKNLVDYGWLGDPSQRAEAETWEAFDEIEHHPDPDDWGNRFPDLWLTVRGAKHQISDDAARWRDQPWKVQAFHFDSRKPGARVEWKIQPALLDSALEKPIGEICASIEQFLSDRRIPLSDVRHIAMIGGSARLQPLRDAMERLFPKRLLPLGEYVDVAVCRGAARLYQAAPPILPVGFDFVVGNDAVLELVKPGASLAKVIRRIQPIRAPHGTSVVARLICKLPDGSTQPYLSLTLPEGFSGEVVGSVSAGVVRLEATQGTETNVAYEVYLS